LTKLNLKPSELKKLRKLTCLGKGDKYLFLGYSLDLETAELRDLLTEEAALGENEAYLLTVLLSHYSSAKPSPKTGELVKFKNLPGGEAYEMAFLQRAVQPIAEVFGANPSTLVEAAKLLGGTKLSHGDAAAEVPALRGIPLVYILWAADEFSASANVLFDESANTYLPTEDLGVLTELTTGRLKRAQEKL
jgi:hypothetical protein